MYGDTSFIYDVFLIFIFEIICYNICKDSENILVN